MIDCEWLVVSEYGRERCDILLSLEISSRTPAPGYTKLRQQTEIFGHPMSGGCGSVHFMPAWTYAEDPDYRPEDIKPVSTS